MTIHTQKYDSKAIVESAQVCGCLESKCTNLTDLLPIYPGQQIQLKLRAKPYAVAMYVNGLHKNNIYDMMPVCDLVDHSTLKLR